MGRPLPGFAVRLAEDGEILVKGSGFHGYLNQPPVDDPWLATGDLGDLDEEGYLYVQGRKKSVIINSFGRNISPEWVEAEMLGDPAIAQIAVFGDGLPWLSAVVTPAPESTPLEIQRAIDLVNQRLPEYARIHGYVIGSGFTLENGELTSNGRPIHQVIEQHFKTRLEALYAPGHAVFL